MLLLVLRKKEQTTPFGVNLMRSQVADVTGTYVRFQPRSADFQEALGDVMEQALQASMFTHSTLTEGEWVQIGHEGTMHDVKVLTLQPEAAVSIIGEMSFHQTGSSANRRNTGTHEDNGSDNLRLHIHDAAQHMTPCCAHLRRASKLWHMQEGVDVIAAITSALQGAAFSPCALVLHGQDGTQMLSAT